MKSESSLNLFLHIGVIYVKVNAIYTHFLKSIDQGHLLSYYRKTTSLVILSTVPMDSKLEAESLQNTDSKCGLSTTKQLHRKGIEVQQTTFCHILVVHHIQPRKDCNDHSRTVIGYNISCDNRLNKRMAFIFSTY